MHFSETLPQSAEFTQAHTKIVSRFLQSCILITHPAKHPKEIEEAREKERRTEMKVKEGMEKLEKCRKRVIVRRW